MQLPLCLEKIEAANGYGDGDGITQTKLVYKAFLSYNQLKEYLNILTESDLLSYDLEAHTFKTTEKGLRFLNTYNRTYDAIKISPPQQQTLTESKGPYKLQLRDARVSSCDNRKPLSTIIFYHIYLLGQLS
jgi:predicted transcriptional regulator